MRKTKIICTLGPASVEERVIRNMILAGMNVVRLNFSHQDKSFHQNNIETVKKLREELSKPVAILLDTKGPEIRTGIFMSGKAELKKGDKFTLTTKAIMGSNTGCYVDCPRLLSAVGHGDKILIDDGKVELVVVKVVGEDIICTVTSGGILGNTRGVNVPGVKIEMPFLSKRDMEDLKFGIKNGVDFVAASFVRSGEDIKEMREFLLLNGGENIKIIAKIENPFAIENFDEILALSDGIMVARGDMGVELPFEKLPGIQKRLIAKCFKCGKTAITATQMLESMIDSKNPTRAEINDVANAVFDSSSAVMLSGETAIGRDPVNVVEVMSKILLAAEQEAFNMEVFKKKKDSDGRGQTTAAICTAAVSAAEEISADAIIAVSHYGETARSVSGVRSFVKLIGATDDIKTYHQLSLNWGIIPIKTESQNSTDNLISHVKKRVKEEGLLKEGDTAVVTAGVPVGVSGNTNLLKIVKI